jgi:hypothetical protein
MSLELKFAMVLLLLTMMTMIAVQTSAVKIDKSAYAACRRVAMQTKAYATWKYRDTIRVDTDRPEGYFGVSP